jgi:Rrf2 family iron-sulfur cluster assembly transcriptional regulator
MMLTTKARYAVTALIYIASQGGKAPIAVEKIADTQNIKVKYLEQILKKLKDKNILVAVKGPGGGYYIDRDAAEITIASIVEAVGESIKMTRCGSEKPGCMKKEGARCATHDLWAGLTKQIYNYLNGITLADVSMGNKSL